MIVSRIDISKALDEMIEHEEGIRFQRLAVLLAKQKWPDLVASEPKKDLGADARASGALAANGQGKILASSLTATLAKIKHDATEDKLRFPDTKVLIFATPCAVSNLKKEQWAEEVRSSFEFELEVMSREEIVSSLMQPHNAVICRTELHIPVEIEPDLQELIPKVAQATSAVALQWCTQKRLAKQPLINLRVIRLGDGARPTEPLATDAVLGELRTGRRIVIEAPAGMGKTTTLIQLAKTISEANGLAFLIDLPEWAKTRRNLLEFIAGMPAFVTNGVGAPTLARTFNVERVALLFNGWNELSGTAAEEIESELRKIDREFPTAGVLVATRAHSIRPPFAGALRVTLSPLTRTERTNYLKEAVGDRSQELVRQLEGNASLDQLTRTPLILQGVTKLFNAGTPLPATKVGILDAVIRLMEETVEHRNELRRAPLSGNAATYLSELSTRLTVLGDVTISETEARRACDFASGKLRDGGQSAFAPQPGEILDALCAHHVLERIYYPEPAFRFEHQQFQEFYAALSLDAVLASVFGDTSDAAAQFTKCYLNVVSWDEPLRMIAEKLGSNSGEGPRAQTSVNQLTKLVDLALRVDPIFASDLFRLAGSTVAPEVADALFRRVRAWYSLDDANHKQCALAAMFASGSEDFGDIVIPLLAGDNEQSRLGTYRIWPEFHLSSLGNDWQRTVSRWTEEARLDFVSEFTINQRRPEVAEHFSLNDPSIEVRIKAVELLSWIGATDQTIKALEAMPQQDLKNALLRLDREHIPPSFQPQLAAAYRDRLSSITDPIPRIRIFLSHPELCEASIVETLKGELTQLATGKTEPYGESVVRTALELIRQTDKQWVSEWAAARILVKPLPQHSLEGLITVIPKTLESELLNRLATENLNYAERSIIAVLCATATVGLAEDVFSRLCTLQREIDASLPARDQLRGTIFRQLEDLLRRIPAGTTVAALSSIFPEPFDAVQFRVVTQMFSRVGREESDLRKELPEELRKGLRCYFKNGVPFALSQDDMSGQLLAHLASALARVGEREDLADLADLIQADLRRLKNIREAASRGQRINGVMGWAMWHLQAVMSLDREQAETIFLRLLTQAEEQYDVEAAKSLLRLATVEEHAKGILPIRTNFEQIWSARAGKLPTEFIEERRQRCSAALRGRVSSLLAERVASSETGRYTYSLPELAIVLATLDGHSSAHLVLQVVALPGRWNGWRRVEALKALLFSGVTLPAEAALSVINPVIEELHREGLYNNNQNMWLLTSVLCLLPFVDTPAVGISRLREALTNTRFPPHELAEIISALGSSRSPNALALLRELAEPDGTRIQDVVQEWINAVAKLDLAESRQILVGFVDPDETALLVQLRIDRDNARALASRIANIATSDSATKQRILQLLNRQLTVERRLLLLFVIAALGTSDVVLAALPTMTDASCQPVPYELWKAFENLFLEHRPYGTLNNTFEIVSRPSNEIRKRLLELVLTDRQHKHSAFAMLGQIEVWHLENGKPVSEPRHPALESGLPWPPLEIVTSNHAGR